MSRQYLRPVRNIALAAIMAMAMSSVVFAAGGNEEDGATDARIAGMNGGRYYGGIHIIAVDEDSPAAEAGLLPDDTIIAVDGEAMQPWFKVECPRRTRGRDRCGTGIKVECPPGCR
jgi:predicted metalloprotease with PDZ domain